MQVLVNKVFYERPLDNGSTPVARVAGEVVKYKKPAEIARAKELARKGIVTILDENVTVIEVEKKTKGK